MITFENFNLSICFQHFQLISNTTCVDLLMLSAMAKTMATKMAMATEMAITIEIAITMETN